MAYQLKEITIRTNNTQEGLNKIDEIWRDIANGKLPLLFDSEKRFLQGISPVSKYSNYASNESGDYDLTIMGVTTEFFQEMEKAVATGKYIKYDEADDILAVSAQKAWEKVWNEQKAGKINREFSQDFESTVPAEYTKDGKAHCYLYISVL